MEKHPSHCRTADFLLGIHSETAEFLRSDCELVFMKVLEPPERVHGLVRHILRSQGKA